MFLKTGMKTDLRMAVFEINGHVILLSNLLCAANPTAYEMECGPTYDAAI
jgi:hypothetical protein